MKFIPLHTTNTSIVYKNSLCSMATIIVLVFIGLSVMIPVVLVSLLSPYSGIAESRVLYEQPHVSFKYQNIFVANMVNGGEEGSKDTSLIVCSSFEQFNRRMDKYTQRCGGMQYWTQNFDYDQNIDRAHFRVELDTMPSQRLESYELALFFEATIKHKCSLSPPALLTHQLILPSASQLNTGTILIKAELQLKQYVEFTCPFPGRNIKTHFRNVYIDETIKNCTGVNAVDIQQYQLESLLHQLKANPAYFQLAVQETYIRHDRKEGLVIQLDLDVLQVPARYHLSVWERLGQFWLYFASFFGISFYIMNKIKDQLFGRHIIRSWEVIPWKKLY